MLANHKTSLGAVLDDIATYVDNIGRSSGGKHDNLTLAIVETKINSKLRPTMSKQIKTTLIVLAAICLISIVCNIVQASGSSTPENCPEDTIMTRKVDSLENVIMELKDSLASKKEKIINNKEEQKK